MICTVSVYVGYVPVILVMNFPQQYSTLSVPFLISNLALIMKL